MKHNCLIAAKSPVNKTHDKIIASYSKMQEAHLYAKFKGEIYTLYIGISLVRGSGCFYKGILFSGGGSEISGIPPIPGIFKWNSPYA